MSTHIWQMETRFHIPANKVGTAFKALREKNHVVGHNRSGEPIYQAPPKEIARCLDLKELIRLWNHEITFDPQGNVTNISKEDFYNEDLTTYLFALLAPSVSPGSFVEYMNEYGDHWRWIFDGKMVWRKTGTVVFDDVPMET